MDTLVTIIDAPIRNIDPLFVTEANAEHINELIHASLIKIGTDLRPVPYLARSVSIKFDTTYDFWLKNNCHFQNGRLITSEDIKNSVALYLDPKQNSAHFSEFKNIQSVKILGPYHFQIILKKPSPAFLSNLNLLKIIPVETYDANKFSQFPIGAGPYKVVKNSVSEISLEKFHSGCLPDAKSPKITIKVIRDDLSRYLKLKRGEIDIVLNELDFRKINYITATKDKSLQIAHTPGITYQYLAINTKDRQLRNLKIRQALALSLDIPSIIRYKQQNFATPAPTPLANLNWFSNPNIKPILRDLNRAKQLLDEAGFYNGENHKPPLILTLKTTTNQFSLAHARVISAQAQEAGIQIKPIALEWGTFYSDIKLKNTQLYILRWVGVTDPSILFDIFHSKLGDKNRTNYKNADMDHYLELAESTTNLEKRKKYYWKAQEIAAQDLPYIGLWHPDNAVVYRSNVKAVTLYPTGSWETFLTAYKE